MNATIRRRFLLAGAGLGVSALALRGLLGRRVVEGFDRMEVQGRDFGNFAAIYGQPELRTEFRLFLENVFHLYPAETLDALIEKCVQIDPRDPAVFRELQERLPEITPFLGSIRYSLPALKKQKSIMAEQTRALLADRRHIDGYLEIGSHGRYYDALRDSFEFTGPVFTTAPRLPTRSPEDVVDRGGLGLVGEPLRWTDYKPLEGVNPGTLDLVSVYIGFHHAALDARAPFFRSIFQALSKEGVLVVRDHDVVSPELAHLVGLAHDVFNVGTLESFETNDSERRNFYTLTELVEMLAAEGFVTRSGRLVQAGDPTKNTLLAFSKA